PPLAAAAVDAASEPLPDRQRLLRDAVRMARTRRAPRRAARGVGTGMGRRHPRRLREPRLNRTAAARRHRPSARSRVLSEAGADDPGLLFGPRLMVASISLRQPALRWADDPPRPRGLR